MASAAEPELEIKTCDLIPESDDEDVLGDADATAAGNRGRSLEQQAHSSAQKRSSLGDTQREELSSMRAPGPSPGQQERRYNATLRPDAGGEAAIPENGVDSLERGRGRMPENAGAAARRAAPGDTQREELLQMRLGAEAERGRQAAGAIPERTLREGLAQMRLDD
eukprot:TRINITY_DN26136_c0_g1_i1.p1 TRINITY_DN26136_c0_g1~~TRINITY_DN26136_c0_g1_i1.p1  ORF type:complete len:166 (+),score=50.94 TRINITY_DN26136_c0_g1_i1:104-601(+)